ncbi:MAG: hypothetical protein H0W61_14725, partial [Bacteroidetes bacterium]|nr:hypothetical protein [Bacteroidota bacterium]
MAEKSHKKQWISLSIYLQYSIENINNGSFFYHLYFAYLTIKNILRYTYISVLLSCFAALNAQLNSFAYKAAKLTGTFGVYHYQPIDLNANTSAEVADIFIDELDNRGIVLKQNDIQLISKNKTALFDQINAGNNDFIINATEVYRRALKTVDSVLNVLSSKTLNFNENDTAYFLPLVTKPFYSPTLKYHAKRIERYVKSKSYDRVCNGEEFDKIPEKDFNANAQEYSKTIIENF